MAVNAVTTPTTASIRGARRTTLPLQRVEGFRPPATNGLMAGTLAIAGSGSVRCGFRVRERLLQGQLKNLAANRQATGKQAFLWDGDGNIWTTSPLPAGSRTGILCSANTTRIKFHAQDSEDRRRREPHPLPGAA